FIVLPSTLPVEVEAEDVFVEAVLGDAIVDNEAGMDYSHVEWCAGWRVINGKRKLLDEGNGSAFRVADLEMCVVSLFVVWTYVFRDSAGCHAVGDKISMHLLDIICDESNFCERVLRFAGRNLF